MVNSWIWSIEINVLNRFNSIPRLLSVYRNRTNVRLGMFVVYEAGFLDRRPISLGSKVFSIEECELKTVFPNLLLTRKLRTWRSNRDRDVLFLFRLWPSKPFQRRRYSPRASSLINDKDRENLSNAETCTRGERSMHKPIKGILFGPAWKIAIAASFHVGESHLLSKINL